MKHRWLHSRDLCQRQRPCSCWKCDSKDAHEICRIPWLEVQIFEYKKHSIARPSVAVIPLLVAHAVVQSPRRFSQCMFSLFILFQQLMNKYGSCVTRRKSFRWPFGAKWIEDVSPAYLGSLLATSQSFSSLLLPPHSQRLSPSPFYKPNHNLLLLLSVAALYHLHSYDFTTFLLPFSSIELSCCTATHLCNPRLL